MVNNGALLAWSTVEPLRAERRVIDAAEALARSLGDNDNHTVAAAVMDVDGHIYQAVNVYHFTGGPVPSSLPWELRPLRAHSSFWLLPLLVTEGGV